MNGGNGWTSTVDFSQLESRVAASAEKAVGAVADDILAASREILPTEGGDLDRSGATSTEREGDTAVAAVSYDTEYAVRQHEQMDLQHERGESAKYLERPVTQAAGDGTAAATIARHMKGAFE